MLLRKRALPNHTQADAPGQLSLRKLPARRRSAGRSLDHGAAIELRRSSVLATGEFGEYEMSNRPGEIDITTGSLDHPEAFQPTKDVFPDEKLPWVRLVAGRH